MTNSHHSFISDLQRRTLGESAHPDVEVAGDRLVIHLDTVRIETTNGQWDDLVARVAIARAGGDPNAHLYRSG